MRLRFLLWLIFISCPDHHQLTPHRNCELLLLIGRHSEIAVTAMTINVKSLNNY